MQNYLAIPWCVGYFIRYAFNAMANAAISRQHFYFLTVGNILPRHSGQFLRYRTKLLQCDKLTKCRCFSVEYGSRWPLLSKFRRYWVDWRLTRCFFDIAYLLSWDGFWPTEDIGAWYLYLIYFVIISAIAASWLPRMSFLPHALTLSAHISLAAAAPLKIWECFIFAWLYDYWFSAAISICHFLWYNYFWLGFPGT